MSTAIVPFVFDGHELRVVIVNGQPCSGFLKMLGTGRSRCKVFSHGETTVKEFRGAESRGCYRQ
jgi:hypothetical protein